MSILSDFLKAAHEITKEVIGGEALTIGGGPSVEGVMSESDFSRDYETGGFELSGSLDVLVGRVDFVAAYPASLRSYEGNAATARGESWRVSKISIQQNFVKVSLVTPNKSS